MLHPAPGNACYAKCLALDNFEVQFFGKESHAGAAPWLGVNAVDALMQAFNNVALLRQQTIPTNR
jgi:metal-dependent amidase/aminoacylase/carboxypeptidase family protein